MISIVIPVYRNEESIPSLLTALNHVADIVQSAYNMKTEVVFVVDGSPDNCYFLLEASLRQVSFSSKLLLHSRNFGSFSAIRTGLIAASGDYFVVLAADLQEPPELVLKFLEKLSTSSCDIVVGCRKNRDDPSITRFASNMFWWFYKKFIISDIPKKGVDVFGCNKIFRKHLTNFEEAHTSLVSLIFWLGFERTEVSYVRCARKHGKSAWTLKKKVQYLLDSIFSFTDFPIRMLTFFGLIGIVLSSLFAVFIILAKLIGNIVVPGYAATVLSIIFFGGINLLGIGIVGSYAWRTYENTKHRPLAIVMKSRTYTPDIQQEEDK